MSSNKRIFSGAYDFIKTDSGLVKAEASGKPNINIDREHTFVTHAFDPDLKDYQRRVFSSFRYDSITRNSWISLCME